MGAPTDPARKTETSRLLSYAFNLYTQVTLVEEGRTPLAKRLPIEGGKRGDVAAAYVGPLEVSVRKDRVGEVVLHAEPQAGLTAPVEEGQVLGRGVAVLNGRELGAVSIVSLESVPKGSWLDRLFH
jgi:D-alanyl-D-alanine carboxypeptidase (penicillin-binding protein 5/6)